MASDRTPRRQLDEFIDRFTPEVASLARGALARMRKLTPGALVELQLSVGFYIMTSKFLETFSIDLQTVTEVV